MRLAVLCTLVAVSAAARAEPPCVCDHPWSFPEQPVVAPTLIDAGPLPPPRVPRNGRIFVTWPDADPAWFELVRDDGTPIAFTVEVASEDAHQFWLVPAAPLDAGAVYTAREGDWSITFAVDDVTDTQPPTHTRVQAQGARMKGRCPEHVAAEVRALIDLEIDGEDHELTLDEGEPYGILYELTVRRLGVAEANEKHIFLRGTQPLLGEIVSDDYRFQECFENYPGAMPSFAYEATVRVWDQAGNMAEAADAEDRRTTFRFAYNVSEGCGCRVSARRSGSQVGAALLLLGLAISARRSRRT